MPYSAIEADSRVILLAPNFSPSNASLLNENVLLPLHITVPRKHKAGEVAVIADSRARNQLLLLAILIEILLEFACPVRNESVGVGAQL